jgi:hypothetical protein
MLLGWRIACAAGAEQNSFERAMAGYLKCQTPGLYFDAENGMPQHEYFRDGGLKPYKVEDDFAYYRISAKYYGLPVVEVMIPAGTWGVRAITFDAPLQKARIALKKAAGLEFRPNERSEDGEVPELITDPEHRFRSILICNDPS